MEAICSPHIFSACQHLCLIHSSLSSEAEWGSAAAVSPASLIHSLLCCTSSCPTPKQTAGNCVVLAGGKAAGDVPFCQTSFPTPFCHLLVSERWLWRRESAHSQVLCLHVFVWVCIRVVTYRFFTWTVKRIEDQSNSISSNDLDTQNPRTAGKRKGKKLNLMTATLVCMWNRQNSAEKPISFHHNFL